MALPSLRGLRGPDVSRRSRSFDEGQFDLSPDDVEFRGLRARLETHIRTNPASVHGVGPRAEASKRKAKLKAAEKDLRERQKREDAECSFQPETKPAPAFVRQMAATRRVARELMEDKENDAVALERPEWR